jgi:hypothetical protein
MSDFYSAEERTYPGRQKSVQIDSVNLSTRGGSWEIFKESALITLVIYEDLFKNFMTGTLVMMDTNGVFEDGPICGDETITITFKTSPEYPRADFTKEFWIYKCDGFSTVHGSRSRVYQLNFAGKAFHKNMEKRLRRSFKGLKEDAIVQNICSNLLEVEVDAEATKFPRDIVMPGWRPLYAINYLATSCVRASGYPASNYVFFETMDKYQFCSIDKLMEAGKKWDIDYHLARIDSPRSNAKLWNAKEYKIIRSFDNIQNSSGGMFAHKFIAQDILRKKIEEKEYIYNGEFGGQVHTDGGGVKQRENHSSSLEQAISYGPWQKEGHGMEYNSKHADDWMKRRRPMIQSLMNWKLELDTEGNSAARLGDKVQFNLISNKAGSSEEDKRLSGEYIITRIKHIITNDQHRMVCEISKDCLKS